MPNRQCLQRNILVSFIVVATVFFLIEWRFIQFESGTESEVSVGFRSGSLFRFGLVAVLQKLSRSQMLPPGSAPRSHAFGSGWRSTKIMYLVGQENNYTIEDPGNCKTKPILNWNWTENGLKLRTRSWTRTEKSSNWVTGKQIPIPTLVMRVAFYRLQVLIAFLNFFCRGDAEPSFPEAVRNSWKSFFVSIQCLV